MIEQLKKEYLELEILLKAKRKELDKAFAVQLEELGQKHSLQSFYGAEYIFDKPLKWQNPKKDTFTKEKFDSFNYLIFNGIFSGKEINTLYENTFYGDTISYPPDQMFATFVIPDEDYCGKKGMQVPLHNVWELLMFKV